jgi:hypothetical protein
VENDAPFSVNENEDRFSEKKEKIKIELFFRKERKKHF